MTEEMQETEDRGQEMDWQAMSDDLKARIAQLEQSIASRDGELAGVKQSLASALAKYRAAILTGSPEMPEELIRGDTVEEIEASVAAARELVGRVRARLEAELQQTSTPIGAPPRQANDLSELSPIEKIKYGLRQSAK